MEKTAYIHDHTDGVEEPGLSGSDVTPEIIDTKWVDDFEDVRHLYDQAPTGITLGLIGSTLLAWWMMDSVPDFIIYPWLAFIALTCITHLFVIKQFRQSGKHIGIENNWVTYNAFLFSMLGLAWGIGYLFFFPYVDGSHQIFLYYAAGILAIGMLPVLSAVLSGYLIFISSVALPLVVVLAMSDANHVVFGVSCIIGSYIILVIIARNYQYSLKNSYALASSVSRKAREIYEDNEITRFDNLKLKKEAENFRRESMRIVNEKEQALKTLQSINEGVITTDSIGKINYINPVAEIYLGWDKREVLGKRIDSVFRTVEEKTRKKLVMPVEKCLNNTGAVNSNGKSILVRRDGVEYAIEYTLTPITDRQSNAIGTVLVFRDVTEKRELEHNLNWQASHDQLTGLINRSEFDRRLQKIINADNDDANEHALCIIDLDNLKIINDSCGHVAGDELLKKIGASLKNKSRDTDTIARIGGDEFGIILYGCTLSKAGLIAEIFREQIEKTGFSWDGRSYDITASLGVIPLDSNYGELSDVLRAADAACFTAKDKGKNQVSLLEQGQKLINRDRSQIQWVEKIRDCLNRQSFELHIQEIRPLDDLNEVVICENLLRVNDENGLILPSQYMPSLERYHMMPEIDRWVVKASLELLAYGKATMDKYKVVTINLSEQSVSNEKFTDYLKNLFDEYETERDRICFDIPEACLYRHAERTGEFIRKIRNMDCKVAIDNFSSGLESFRILKPLNIDYVKFDGRISYPYSDKSLEYTILESINHISHLIGAQTVAKFISGEENLEALYEIGVDYAQGFVLSRPRPLK